jgi:hypothetical protein
LYEWVRRGNYVAVVAFRLPSLLWKSSLESRQYCSCEARHLFVYLLTPSADQAEQIYSHLASLWKGPSEAMAYLPFTPRPSSQFDVAMTLIRQSGKTQAQVPAQTPPHFTNPEQGVLPRFTVQMTADEAEVRFQVAQAAFEDPAARTGPGFFNVDWSKVPYEWQLPVPLTLRDVPDTAAASAAKPGVPPKGIGSKATGPAAMTVAPTNEPLGLEFTQLPAVENEAAPSGRSGSATTEIVRLGHFQARSTLLANDKLSQGLATVRLRVRKRPGHAKGCELYLIQLDTKSTDLPRQIADSLPLVKTGVAPCLDMNSITTQMRFVYRRSPIVRFLVHIDY